VLRHIGLYAYLAKSAGLPTRPWPPIEQAEALEAAAARSGTGERYRSLDD